MGGIHITNTNEKEYWECIRQCFFAFVAVVVVYFIGYRRLLAEQQKEQDASQVK
jgi:Tfp pilus assembly protein PilO